MGLPLLLLVACGVGGFDLAGTRRNLVASIWGSDGPPTTSEPQSVSQTNVTGLERVVWNITDKNLSLTSTTFYFPVQKGAMADCVVLMHHGHANGCDAAGCTWWDFYNVTDFVHVDLGCDYYMLYMPLFAFNKVEGVPSDHSFFGPYQAAGYRTLRFFIEPVILTVNRAEKQGYKNVYMMGKSGGGWTTTVVAAVEPRIQVSFPIAGSIPLKFHHRSWDFEQQPQLPDAMWYLPACDYQCLYALAAFGPHRYSVQLLHEDDPCCYFGRGRHTLIKQYIADVGAVLNATDPREGGHGGFSTAVTDWNLHEVCPRDRVVMKSALSQIRHSSAPDFGHLPCDILHQQTTDCPV
eukprot:Hpha_TRINITY_DN4345_c0_g1::TRINITY_DN4345_c0_g1_i1::g.50019::m.50019